MPSDYTYAEKSWGKSFYKIYSATKNYTDAKAQCESDGSFLAIPRSEAESDFIADLIPNEHIWIGINDIEHEGRYMDVHGSHISYTNWANGQPDNYQHNPLDEDGMMIRKEDKKWNDYNVSYNLKFVCSKSVCN